MACVLQLQQRLEVYVFCGSVTDMHHYSLHLLQNHSSSSSLGNKVGHEGRFSVTLNPPPSPLVPEDHNSKVAKTFTVPFTYLLQVI